MNILMKDSNKMNVDELCTLKHITFHFQIETIVSFRVSLTASFKHINRICEQLIKRHIAQFFIV